MTSWRQIQANRLNARLSTGPVTQEGKARSRQNAVRHGLTAETVIQALEDAQDYEAFQMSVTAGYEPQSAVERELILRLASVLWRLRRATNIETGLFRMQARDLLKFRQSPESKRHMVSAEICSQAESVQDTSSLVSQDELTRSFVRLNDLEGCPFDRLSRYEAALWRQAAQIIFVLHSLNRKSSWRNLR